MSKIPEGVKIYPLTESQKLTAGCVKYSIHKSIAQIPVYILTGKKIDFDLMRKALAEEFRRNDCLRLRYFQKKKVIYQYFLPECELPEIPFRDFSGADESEWLNWLKKDARTYVNFLKGESWRFKFFIAPDGRTGLYANITHGSVDMFAIFAFLKDLLEVYDALEKGTELPRPLTRFEDILPKELAFADNAEEKKRQLEFYRNLFTKEGQSFYAGVDGMRQLNALRKKKKDPELNCVWGLEPFHDKTENLKYHISGEEVARMQEFCINHGTTMQMLMSFGMRTWLSRINGFTKDVYILSLLNRRATVSEKRCGGCMVNSVPLRTVLEENLTFVQALNSITGRYRDIMRYGADLSQYDVGAMMREIDHQHLPIPRTSSMVLSFIPHGAFTIPEGWNIELSGVSIGHFASTLYTMMLPSFVDGGMDCYYEYRTYNVTAEEITAFFEGTMKVIRAGIADPDITLDKLLHEVLQ